MDIDEMPVDVGAASGIIISVGKYMCRVEYEVDIEGLNLHLDR